MNNRSATPRTTIFNDKKYDSLSRKTTGDILEDLSNAKNKDEVLFHGSELEKKTGQKPSSGWFDYFVGPSKSNYHHIQKDYTKGRIEDLYNMALERKDKTALERIQTIYDITNNPGLDYKKLVDITRKIERMHEASNIMPLEYAVSSKEMFEIVGVNDESLSNGYYSYENMIRHNESMNIRDKINRKNKDPLTVKDFSDFYMGMASSAVEVSDIIKNAGAWALYIAGKSGDFKTILSIAKTINDFSLSDSVMPKDSISAEEGKRVGDIAQMIGTVFVGAGVSPKALTSVKYLSYALKNGKLRALKGFSAIVLSKILNGIIDKEDKLEPITKDGLKSIGSILSALYIGSLDFTKPVEPNSINKTYNNKAQDMLNNSDSEYLSRGIRLYENSEMDTINRYKKSSLRPNEGTDWSPINEVFKENAKESSIDNSNTSVEDPIDFSVIKMVMENEKGEAFEFKRNEFNNFDRENINLEASKDYSNPNLSSTKIDFSKETAYKNVEKKFIDNNFNQILDSKGYALKKIDQKVRPLISEMVEVIKPAYESTPENNLLTYESLNGNNQIIDLGLSINDMQEKASFYSLIKAAERGVPSLSDKIRNVNNGILVDNVNAFRRFGLNYNDAFIKDINSGVEISLQKVPTTYGFVREYKNAIKSEFDKKFSIFDKKLHSTSEIKNEVKPLMNNITEGIHEILNDKNLSPLLVDINPNEFKLSNGDIVGPGVVKLLNNSKSLDVRSGSISAYDAARQIRNDMSKGKTPFKYSNKPVEQNYNSSNGGFAKLYDLITGRAQEVIDLIEKKNLSKSEFEDLQSLKNEYRNYKNVSEAYNIKSYTDSTINTGIANKLMKDNVAVKKMLDKVREVSYEERTNMLDSGKYKDFYQNELTLGQGETYADRFVSLSLEESLKNEFKSLDKLTSGLSNRQKSNAASVAKIKTLVPKDNFSIATKFIEEFALRSEAKTMAKFRDFSSKSFDSNNIIATIDRGKVNRAGYKLAVNVFVNFLKGIGISGKTLSGMINLGKNILSNNGEISTSNMLSMFIDTIFDKFINNAIIMGGKNK